MIRIRHSVLPIVLLALGLSACGVRPQPTVLPVDSPPASATSTLPAPAPSPTSSPADAILQSPVPPSACTAHDLDAYVAVVSPLLDQVIVAAREATQLQALSTDRVMALVDAASLIHDQLSATQAPACLQDAHFAAVAGAALLGQALDGIASGTYSDAEENLRSSYEQTSLAVALIGMQYWEQTPTPTEQSG
jgi:hypothetical protein